MNYDRLEQGTKEALSPEGFNCKGILIKNHHGRERDIQRIVVEFSLSESLYSNSVIAKFSVKDSTNFFEKFPITGQETVQLILERKTTFTKDTAPKRIELNFFITEYPIYGRSGQHTQVYSFSGIASHAFGSSFRQISRSYNGLTSEEIRKILLHDCNVLEDNFRLTGDPISTAKGIITRQRPLRAANWLLSKTFDEQLAPFFLFHTIWNKVQLSSYTSLVSQEAYGQYIHTTGFSQNAQTSQDYAERSQRILELASDLQLGKVFQGQAGAFASNNNSLDLTYKTYTKYDYSYTQDLYKKKNSLEKGTVLSRFFQTASAEIDSLHDAHSEYISVNKGAYDGQSATYNDLRQQTHGITNAYREVLDTTCHELVLHGDMGLNPGRVVDLRFQRAMDPQSMKELLDKNPRDIWDEHMSGRYLITSAIHQFKEGKYYTNIKVKRDSFAINIDNIDE